MKSIFILFLLCALGCTVSQKGYVGQKGYLDDRKESFYIYFAEFYDDSVTLYINKKRVLKDAIISDPRFDTMTGQYEVKPHSWIIYKNDSLITSISGRKKYIPNFPKTSKIALSFTKKPNETIQQKYDLINGHYFWVENYAFHLNDSVNSSQVRIIQYKEPIKTY